MQRRLPMLALLFLSCLMLGCDFTSMPTQTTSVSITSAMASTNPSATTISTETISSDTPQWIMFDAMGGTPIASLQATFPTLIQEPTPPNRLGHLFHHWSADPSCGTSWDFPSDLATEPMTLYACYVVQSFTLSFVFKGSTLETIHQPYGSAIAFPEINLDFGYRFVGWISNLTGEPFASTTVPAEHLVLVAKVEMERYELPILNIDLPVDIAQVDKYTYVDALYTLWDKDGQTVWSGISGEFRGRGNGSWWTIDKKGYRIKLDEKASVFGLTPSRHWVLVPGTYDYGTTRNAAAYTLTNEVFDGIEYTTSVHYVDVYVNGEYYGLYNWFEKVRVEESRVDIESEFGILDTGYLIEYDSYACCADGIDSFWIPNLRYGFTVHSPEPDEWIGQVSEETYRAQIAWIKAYVQSVVDAVFEGDAETLEELVDLDSMVDFYLIHELFKNTDTGWSSVYLYKKPGGRLYFGPLWDFDFSAGVSRGESHPEGLYVADTVRDSSDFTSSEIFIELMTQDWFIALVKARWLSIDQDVKSAVMTFYASIEGYAESFERDAAMWPWQTSWYAEQRGTAEWLLQRSDWLTDWATN